MVSTLLIFKGARTRKSALGLSIPFPSLVSAFLRAGCSGPFSFSYHAISEARATKWEVEVDAWVESAALAIG